MRVVVQAETDAFASRVLKQNWPGVPNVGDADSCRGTLSTILERGEGQEQPPGPVAGPVLLLENVPGIRGSGLHRILQDLATVGFDAEWFTLCSCHFGTPHHRERVYVIAYPNGNGEPFVSVHEEASRLRSVSGQVPWPDPPEDLGVDDGIPNRTHRLRCLGNAVVPQVAEWIGRRIVEATQ